jgi:hypothetical protein
MPKRSDDRWPGDAGPTFPPDEPRNAGFPGGPGDDHTRVGGGPGGGPRRSPESAAPGAPSDHTQVYRPPQPVEAAPVSFAWLVAVEGDAKGKTFNLFEGQNLIGRHAECTLRFHNPHISTFHATLRLKDGGAKLWDLGSTNGTRLNGAEVTAAVELKDGDRLELPDQVLVFKKV